MAFSIFKPNTSPSGYCTEGVPVRLLSLPMACFRFMPALFILAEMSFGTCGGEKYSLTDWKFYFAGKDSGNIFARYDTSRVYAAVKIPHVFPQENHGQTPPVGFGWYYRDIEIPGSFINKDIFLEFEGVALRSDVYIDGVRAGGSGFAYMPFSVNCTPFIAGKTQVRCAVRVDNRFLSRQIPDRNAKGWWKYGGIFREVYLAAQSNQRIDSVRISTIYYAKDTFGLHLILKPAGVLWDSVVLAIVQLDRSLLKYKATLHGTDTLLRIGGVRGWTPETPVRYSLYMEPFFKGKTGDTFRLLRGFCQLLSQKNKLYLNGNPYYLRGMGRHDVLGDKGPLLTREDRLRDLVDLKSLGVNFLRIAHFPQHRDVYDLCDSLGILVMDEIPVWKTDSRFLGSLEGRDYGAKYMKRLIAAHGNYSCVCMWSLGNQFASFKTSVAGYVGAVAKEVKEFDPSRLTTFCSFYYIWDKAFSFVDVISINEYFGWELASLDMLAPMLDKINKDWPDKPVLVSELGAQAEIGLRNAHPRLAGAIKSIYSKDLSEDHQALFIQEHIDTIWSKRAYVNGMVVWAYADYLTSQNKARTAAMPAGLNACGIVTEDRKQKLSYRVVKERYTSFLKTNIPADAFPR
jgi:beta-glucuronidase